MVVIVLSYMGRRIATLDDVNFEGKKVLLRVDVNSPINPGSGDILDASRIAEHSITVKELVEGRAAVTIISHQGRPLDSDFASLKAHATILSNLLGVEVKFVDDVIGPEARRAVEALEPGEVLMLDNTRLLAEDNIEAPPDKHSESFIVRRLAPLFHLFVNDAFATCHRSQATIVGFPLRIPSVAGRVLERELRALNNIVEMEGRPKVFVLGGAKLDDTVEVIKYVVESGIADYVLTTGLVSLLFLLAKGVRVPKDVEKLVLNRVSTGNFGEARSLVSKHGNIRTPIDFMVEDRGVIMRSHYSRLRGAPKDIGPSTIEYYSNILSKAKIIVMRGPAGVIEDPRFRAGTEDLVRSALDSGAFTVFGGGHFNAMLSKIPEKLKTRIGHVSTGGGALLYFLSGKLLPGLEALARSNEIFKVLV